MFFHGYHKKFYKRKASYACRAVGRTWNLFEVKLDIKKEGFKSLKIDDHVLRVATGNTIHCPMYSSLVFHTQGKDVFRLALHSLLCLCRTVVPFLSPF
jgi:hypothetical protein